MTETQENEQKTIKNLEKELESAGVDPSKLNLRGNSVEPIHCPSACDVYRNNKAFLWRLITLYKYPSTRETVAENFGAKTLKEAEEKFEKMNWYLPTHWYNKLKKKFDTFKDVFEIDDEMTEWQKN